MYIYILLHVQHFHHCGLTLSVLAYWEQKLSLIDQKLSKILLLQKVTLRGISAQAITCRQIELESCSNPLKTREGM